MKKRLRFSTKARTDLRDLAVHIATVSGSVAVAARFVLELEERMKLLLVTPQMGRAAKRAGVRELILDDYIIPYRLNDDVIEVLRVQHGARRK